MAAVPSLRLALIYLLVAFALQLVAPQRCDHNPLANNGVIITPQASTSCLKGRTSDMVDVAACQNDSAHDIRLPFAFKYLNRTYGGSSGSSSVFVGSNSYVTFGGSSNASSGLGPQTPALPTLFIGGRDNILRSLSVGSDALGWRVRYEGAVASAQICSPALMPTIIWELLFGFDGSMQLCTGVVADGASGISGLSDGVSSLLLQKFHLTPSTLYIIFTGSPPCPCRSGSGVNSGVTITSRFSSTCMKGRTPDMIDLRSCSRAGTARVALILFRSSYSPSIGSTSIMLPFPFKFLGQTYGGYSNDVFVADASFVTFGGSDGSHFSTFGPDFSPLPALLIGARQNVLKTLSVAPDSLGWRVRYEGQR
jgi:hypothetical protein